MLKRSLEKTNVRGLFDYLKNGQAVCEQVQEKLSIYQRYLLEEIPEADQLLVADVLRKISAKTTSYEDGMYE